MSATAAPPRARGAESAGALREHVEALSSIERLSATPGERRSAEWVRDRLAESGVPEVELAGFRYSHTFGYAHAAHMTAGVAAALRGGRAGAALAAAVAVSYDLEFSGRLQWVRSLMPASAGTNVVGHLRPRGGRRRTLVIAAHHDAAHTGLMWDPRLLAHPHRHAERSGEVDSYAKLPTQALAAVALGSLARRRARRSGRLLRLAGGAVLAAVGALTVQVARGPVVPGASDNASGVAALLELARALAADPPPSCEVILLSQGCEESGMGGMAAWMRSEGRRLDRRSTLFVGLDLLGAGTPAVLAGEGGVRTERYGAQELALVDAGARSAGEPPPRRWRMGGWTDAVLARHAGIPAVSLTSVRDGGYPNYHRPSDTPENVDFDCVAACARIARGIVDEWIEGQPL